MGIVATVGVAGVVGAVGCRATSHPVQSAGLGVSTSSAKLEAVLERPGPIEVETVRAADWEVPLGGLLNLDHPRARAAGLEDRPEPIQIYFHALRHRDRGLFIIDTGVERALRVAPERAALRGLAADAMNVDALRVRTDTASWLAAQGEPLAGVLFTHLHLDHLTGMPDVPKKTPLYAGPGDDDMRNFLHLFSAPITDRALEGHEPIGQWRFESDPSGLFEGVVDVFGDQSLWALHVPGHTPGSTAYLAMTPTRPVLFVGDACHTRWGWENGVEPGSFSHDREQSAKSLARLRRFAAEHPNVEVRLGHQSLRQ